MFTSIMMNNKDAQFLEAKEFSVIEIARLFRMPPVMIQVTDKGMSFASVEQLNIMFVQYTIQPWATRWERAIKTAAASFNR
jgi:phage portal protein BeeE